MPVNSPQMIIKLQFFGATLCNCNWLYAYLRSWFEKYDCCLFCVSVSCCDVKSLNILMVGIWYWFLWINLLRTLESNASFIDWSLFTVITIVDMNFSSEQPVNSSMCPFCCRQSNSIETLGCSLIRTRRPFLMLCYELLMKPQFNYMCPAKANS